MMRRVRALNRVLRMILLFDLRYLIYWRVEVACEMCCEWVAESIILIVDSRYKLSDFRF